ncbi:MAG: NAD(P)/FAD-dependent oxidoreductase [Reyranella sp.]
MGATRKRNLRSGHSIWQRRALLRFPERPLSRDTRCDVLVIGAGITGAMAAEQLTDAGLSVVVLDRRGAVRGSTLASTALLQYEIDTPLAKLADRIGRTRAERIWRRSRLALDALRDRTRRLGIAADCVDKSSLYLEGNVLDAAGLRIEATARRRAGFEVSLLSANAVRDAYGIRGRTGLLSDHNLEANPRRLAVGFLRIALARGARFYAPVEAIAVEPHASGVTVLTDQATIRARHVVFATGYELPKGVPRKGHRIATTWAIATRPQPRGLWAGRGFIWEASDPYLYLRVGPDGRIICGGEDETFSDAAKRDALSAAKVAAIEGKLAKLLPHVDARADYGWCGNFGTSTTGTPSIGPVPGMRHCYAVLGYGGNGITFSMMAAQILRGDICGDGDADADLFSFTRRF